LSCHGKFIIIHNGIIENYATLKERLKSRGVSFRGETDTEVLVNLIEYIYLKGNVTAEMATRLALSKVEGAYGIVVMCTDEKDKLIAARKGSPLVIGVGEDEYFLASDATPIVEYTKNVIYLNDNDVAVLSQNELILKTIKNIMQIPQVQKIDLDVDEIDKVVMHTLCLRKSLNSQGPYLTLSGEGL
jgi:glucosamine--fructose-6-phosphate aminotransferase (isomerizing)